MKILISYIIGTALFFSVASYAGPQPPIDCQGAPKNALLEIPEFMGEWVGIYCSPNGHALVPKFGHLWVAKNNKPFFLFANFQTPVPPAGKHGSFFKKGSFGYLRLSGNAREKVMKLYELQTQSTASFEDVVQMELLSNDGNLFTVFFYMNKNGPEWVLHCADRCRRAVMVKAGSLEAFKTNKN